MVKGIFITLEGIDGSGKSTQATRLAKALREDGHHVLPLREPGGTPVSEAIRSLVLDPAHPEMSPECELLLMEAARAQLVREVVQPALQDGFVVVCDRFYDSTYAYQHGGRGIDEDAVIAANGLGSCGTTPDLTLVFDIDPALAYGRATAGGADRMEAAGLAFQRGVRDAYLRLADAEPRRVRLIDASGTPDEVFGLAWEAVAEVVRASCP